MIFSPPSQNAIQKTLDAQLLSGVTASMTLNNVTGIQNLSGVCVIDAVDANGNETPAKREYIIFTGVSGSTLTTLTRNADGGGTDQDHSVGAIVQFCPDVLQQQAILDALLLTVTTDGALDTTKVVDLTTAQTLTNKRIEPRIVTATSYTTDTGISLTVATADIFQVTAQAGALKFNNPGGTPVNGQKLIVRIKDDGTAQALTYDTQFRASSDLALPTTTVLGKTLYMGFMFNATDTRWDLLAVLDNF